MSFVLLFRMDKISNCIGFVCLVWCSSLLSCLSDILCFVCYFLSRRLALCFTLDWFYLAYYLACYLVIFYWSFISFVFYTIVFSFVCFCLL